MFTHEEMDEINTLCGENELFAKYVNKFRQENDKILAMVAHELGNPLTLIHSTAQLIESRNPEVHEIKYWDQLRNDIESMRELFLSFSQYRCCSSLNCQETDIIDLVDETVESFQAAAAEKKVSITMEEPEELDATLFSYVCDTVKVRQAIVNLIKNALEAANEDGKIQVRVLGKGKECSDYIKIEIANDGQLIEKEDLETVFDFGVSSKGEGRGLGLPIVHKIIEAHHGMLKVASEEKDKKRETIFSIYLPVGIK